MAQIIDILPDNNGHILIIDDKRPKGVNICKEGTIDFLHILETITDQNFRRHYQQNLGKYQDPIYNYLTKLALDNTSEGIPANDLIRQITSVYEESLSQLNKLPLYL